jgi:aminomethyltransferase
MTFIVSSDMATKTTPLHAAHIEMGARMTKFAGYEMPIQYSSITDEHKAVRNAVGVFDVSHMGEFLVSGPSAEAFVQNLVTNDVTKLYDGRAMYTVMCNDEGGIVDDLLVYRLATDRFLLVVNAANIDKDFAWASQHNHVNARLVNQSDEFALIAVQGPHATTLIQRLTVCDLEALKFYHFETTRDDGQLPEDVVISRTGYTGEPGYELYCRTSDATAIWNNIFRTGADLGVKPVGLGARDTLRLEAGYCLYGNDLDDETNPLEAGLSWVTKLDKGPFVGSPALSEIRDAGLARRLVAFVMEERGIPRSGYSIFDDNGREVGIVTSGTQSPILAKGIGMGYVENRDDLTSPGSSINVNVRGRDLRGTIKKPPLHK